MIAHAKALGVQDVAITTNATLLGRRLDELLEAGLDRVNISLDALSPEVFRRATGGRQHRTGVAEYRDTLGSGGCTRSNSTPW